MWSGAVIGRGEVPTNDNLVARQMIVDVEDRCAANYKMIGCSVRMEKLPARVTADTASTPRRFSLASLEFLRRSSLNCAPKASSYERVYGGSDLVPRPRQLLP